MSRRRLLLITYYFPPWGMGGVQRPLKLAKYLPACGWDVTVVAPAPGAYHEYDPSLLEELPADATVHRLSAGMSNRLKGRVQGEGASQALPGLLHVCARGVQQWLRWPDDKRGFARRAQRLAVQLAKDTHFDAVLTTSPPPSVHLAGMALSRELRIPWVADFRDPWLVRRDDWGPAVLHVLYNRRLRRRMLQRANAVIATSDTTARELSRNRQTDAVHAIPNGFDEDDFTGIDERAKPGPITLALYGTLSPSIGVEQLLGVLGAYRDRHPDVSIRVRHIGASPGTDGAALIDACGLTDVFETTGYLPHRVAVCELMTADIACLSMSRDTDLDGTIPGRTFEVLRSLKPILLCAPRSGALARLLDRHDGIWHFNPGDVRAGFAAIHGVLTMSRRGPARTLDSIAQFDRREQARQFADILNVVSTSVQHGTWTA